jgi:hypothetical protein
MHGRTGAQSASRRRRLATAGLTALTLGAAVATAAPGASAAQPGYGPGYGPGGGRGPRGRMHFGAGPDFTPGWGMMTPQEREQHRQQMGNAKTPDECRQLRDEHRKLMQERARERGIATMPGPRHDACARRAG